MAEGGASGIGQIPFSVYDYFGILAPGFVIIAAVDKSFQEGWILRPDLTWPSALLWVGAAFILGHVLANISGWLLEATLLVKALGRSEAILLGQRTSRLRRIFPGYFQALPPKTQGGVASRVGFPIQPDTCRAAFLAAQPTVRKSDGVRAKLDLFVAQYGFARNTSLACILAAIVLIGSGIVFGRVDSSLWGIAALGACVGLFYRYLKFYRQYTYEVFINYAAGIGKD
jgi:hypothetical protein